MQIKILFDTCTWLYLVFNWVMWYSFINSSDEELLADASQFRQPVAHSDE